METREKWRGWRDKEREREKEQGEKEKKEEGKKGKFSWKIHMDSCVFETHWWEPHFSDSQVFCIWYIICSNLAL